MIPQLGVIGYRLSVSRFLNIHYCMYVCTCCVDVFLCVCTCMYVSTYGKYDVCICMYIYFNELKSNRVLVGYFDRLAACMYV